MAQKTGSYKTLIFMISATMLGKVLGLVRDMILANLFGTGTAYSAFVVASRLPLNFFDIALGAAVSSAFIPTFNEVIKTKGKDKGITFANEFINIVFYVALFLTAIGMAFTPFFVSIIGGNLAPETYTLAVELTRIMFPMLIFAALAFSFVGILQSFGEFNVPAAISVISNLVIILYIVLFNRRFGIQGLAVAMVVGWAMQMAVQLPFLYKKGMALKPVIHFHSKELKQVGIIMIPILISTWVQPINIWVNTRLAAGISATSDAEVAVLDYANKLFIIIAGVIVLAITNLIFPSLSKYLATGDKKSYRKLLTSALQMVLFYMTPITIGVIVLSEPLVRLLYMRGEFGEEDVRLVAMALNFYGAGIVFYGFREVLNKAYYAIGDAKTPMNLAVVGIGVNIALSFILVKPYGANGLAAAASLAAFFLSSVLLWRFNKTKEAIAGGRELLYAVKALISALVMGMAVKVSYGYLAKMVTESGVFINAGAIGASVVIGVGLYFLLARLLGMKIPSLHIERGA